MKANPRNMNDHHEFKYIITVFGSFFFSNLFNTGTISPRALHPWSTFTNVNDTNYSDCSRQCVHEALQS